jgi:hypothetical protein
LIGGLRSGPERRSFGRRHLLENRRFGARDIAADKRRNRPHHHGHGDNDGGENEHALQYRRVQPHAVVVEFFVIVIVAHRSRLILQRRDVRAVTGAPFDNVCNLTPHEPHRPLLACGQVLCGACL